MTPDLLAGSLQAKAQVMAPPPAPQQQPKPTPLFTPQFLEEQRGQGIGDDTVADYLAAQNPSFRSQLMTVKQRSGNDPRAITAFLNYRMYGDTAGPPQEEEKGFFGRVGETIQERAVGMGEAFERGREGKQTLAETAFQTAAQFAGAAGDALAGGAKQAGYLASALTPDAIEEPVVEAVKGMGQQALESAPGQYLAGKAGDVAGGYEEWKKKHPRAAANLEAAIDIASLIPIGKLAKVGTEVVEQGVKGAAKATARRVGRAKDFITRPIKKYEAMRAAALAKNAEIDSLNQAYLKELARPKVHADLSVPARSTKMDLQFSREGKAIIQEGKVTGYVPDTEITNTLKRHVTDPNNIPQSIQEIGKAKATLSKQARDELRKQTAGKIGRFQSESYRASAIKEVRTALSKTMDDPANDVLFATPEEFQAMQKIASRLEQQYQTFLKASKGEKELAKLDLRQWMDRLIGDRAFDKDLSELPPATRALRVFRGTLNESIDRNAKAIGGEYAKYMKEITNLYKAEETVGTHLPKPEGLMQQFAVPEVKLPNAPVEVPPTVGELAKQKTKSAAKKAAQYAVPVGIGSIIGSELLR